MADDTTPTVPPSPPDPSQYIRTYAKDMAALSGNPAEPVPPSAPKRPASPAPLPEPEVTLPEVEASLAQHSDVRPPDFAPEVLATSKEDERDVLASKAVPQSEPSVFSSIPHTPIAVTPVVTQAEPAVAQAREGILARLRAKADQNRAPAAPAGPTLQSILGEATGAGPLPSMPPVSKDLPKAPPPSASDYVAAPAPAASQEVQAPSNLHTYKTDFADRIDQQQASTFSVLAAASDARQAAASPAAPKRALVPVIAGAMLFVAGIGIVGGAAYYYFHLPKTAHVAQIPSLVVPDETVEFQGQGPGLMQSLATLAAAPSVSGNVIVVYLSSSTQSKGGFIKTPEPGGALIEAMQLPAPSILLRNLDPLSTVGVINTGSDAKPFFILRVTSYERSFAGMLGWEPSIGDDLKLLYPAYPDQSVTTPIATTTVATTTPVKKAKIAPKPVVFVPPVPQPPHFVDETVVSHDVRALKDSSNRTILLYGYHDKATLIIARSEDAFTALVNRLNATGGQ